MGGECGGVGVATHADLMFLVCEGEWLSVCGCVCGGCMYECVCVCVSMCGCASVGVRLFMLLIHYNVHV